MLFCIKITGKFHIPAKKKDTAKNTFTFLPFFSCQIYPAIFSHLLILFPSFYYRQGNIPAFLKMFNIISFNIIKWCITNYETEVTLLKIGAHFTMWEPFWDTVTPSNDTVIHLLKVKMAKIVLMPKFPKSTIFTSIITTIRYQEGLFPTPFLFPTF